MKAITLSTCAALILAGGIGLALVAQQPIQVAEQVYRSDVIRVSRPLVFTEAEELAYATAVANNEPLPAGWTKISSSGTVTATLTGYIDAQTFEKQLTVTIRDESADLDTARLYLNGTLVFMATRASGAIVDRSGFALATMSTLVPASGHYTLEASWLSVTGVNHSDLMSL